MENINQTISGVILVMQVTETLIFQFFLYTFKKYIVSTFYFWILLNQNDDKQRNVFVPDRSNQTNKNWTNHAYFLILHDLASYFSNFNVDWVFVSHTIKWLKSLQSI